MKYYLSTYSTADTPPYISLHDNTGEVIRVLEDNADLSNKMEEFDLTKEFFSFTTSEGVNLNGWMIKPQTFPINDILFLCFCMEDLDLNKWLIMGLV